jgi:hypothetical protein
MPGGGIPRKVNTIFLRILFHKNFQKLDHLLGILFFRIEMGYLVCRELKGCCTDQTAFAFLVLGNCLHFSGSDQGFPSLELHGKQPKFINREKFLLRPEMGKNIRNSF